jgi:hypothetical protein
MASDAARGPEAAEAAAHASAALALATTELEYRVELLNRYVAWGPARRKYKYAATSHSAAAQPVFCVQMG